MLIRLYFWWGSRKGDFLLGRDCSGFAFSPLSLHRRFISHSLWYGRWRMNKERHLTHSEHGAERARERERERERKKKILFVSLCDVRGFMQREDIGKYGEIGEKNLHFLGTYYYCFLSLGNKKPGNSSFIGRRHLGLSSPFSLHDDAMLWKKKSLSSTIDMLRRELILQQKSVAFLEKRESKKWNLLEKKKKKKTRFVVANIERACSTSRLLFLFFFPLLSFSFSLISAIFSSVWVMSSVTSFLLPPNSRWHFTSRAKKALLLSVWRH